MSESSAVSFHEFGWQQKAAALNAIATISIRCRGVGDWYISQSVDIGGNGMLEGAYGNGGSPIDAIEDHWRVLVDELPPGKFLVVQAYANDRKQLRWNGFMWCEVPE